MKRGKDISRVDKGWDKLFPILETELPQKKERDRALWLWLIPVGLIVLSALTYYGMNNPTDLKTPTIDKQPLQLAANENAETKNSLATTTEIQLTQSSSAIEKKDTEKTITTKEEKSIITNPENSTSASSSASRPSMTVRKQEQKSIAARNTTDLTTIITARENTTFENTSTERTDKATTGKSSITTEGTSSISPLLEQLSVLSFYQPTLNRLTPNHLPNILLNNSEDYTPALVELDNAASRKTHYDFTVAAGGFYSTDYEAPGLSLDLGYQGQSGQVLYGLIAGAGYHFGTFTPASLFEAGVNDVNNMSNDEIDVNTGQSGAPEGRNAIYLPTKDHKLYIHTGLFIGYQLAPKVSIRSQWGLEKYWPNETEVLASNERLNQAMLFETSVFESAPTKINSLVPYSELSLEWAVSQQFAIRGGYRYGLKEFLNFQELSYSTNKFNIQALYSF